MIKRLIIRRRAAGPRRRRDRRLQHVPRQDDRRISSPTCSRRRSPSSVIEVEPITWRPGIEAIGTAHAAARASTSRSRPAASSRSILFSANDQVEAGQHLAAARRRDRARRPRRRASATLELSRTELDARPRTAAARRQRRQRPRRDRRGRARPSARAQVTRLTAMLEPEGARGAVRRDRSASRRSRSAQYVTPGTVFATLQDLDTMRVDFSIPEQQVAADPDRHCRSPSPPRSDDAELRGKITGIEPQDRPQQPPRHRPRRGRQPRRRSSIPASSCGCGSSCRRRPTSSRCPQTVLSSTLYGDFGLRRARRRGRADAASTVEQVFVKVGRRSRGLVEIIEGVAARRPGRDAPARTGCPAARR